MTVWPSLTTEEYEVAKRVIGEFDDLERRHGDLRTHPNPAFRTADEMRAQMRAAVEGYEAANREAE